MKFRPINIRIEKPFCVNNSLCGHNKKPCGALDGGWFCTRNKGHSGHHVACVSCSPDKNAHNLRTFKTQKPLYIQ